MEFKEWLYEQLNKRGWSQSELARRANISQSMISATLTGIAKPGPKTCTGIAKALNVSPETVMEKAKLIPKQQKRNEEEEIKKLLPTLSNRALKAILNIIKEITESN